MTNVSEPVTERDASLPLCCVTCEREGWILRRIAHAFAERTARFRCEIVHHDEAVPPGADCVFYSSWHHYWLQPANVRKLPFVALVTHLDRFAFRIACMARHRHARISCMSDMYLKQLRRYGIPARKLVLTPLGIEPSHFTPPAAPCRAEGKVNIGVVGRLYPDGRKGERLLTDIAARLDPATTKLTIVGDRWDELLPTMQSRSLEVVYRRNVPDTELPGEYRDMDALLITSRREGGPIPALEAIACGTPVISTPVGYVPDLVDALPFAGVLFKTAAHATSLAAQCRAMKDELTARREDVARVLASYTWDAFARATEAAMPIA